MMEDEDEFDGLTTTAHNSSYPDRVSLVDEFAEQIDWI